MVWGEKGLLKEREGKREGAKEGESRAQDMGKFILRLECVYTPLALPSSHLNNLLFSWFGVTGVGKIILRLECVYTPWPCPFTLE